MKRVTAILVLLLAIVTVAGSVLPPAAYAVPNTGNTSGSLDGSTRPVPAAAATSGDDDGKGDPGGAGDGLGVDIKVVAGEVANDSRSRVVVEIMFRLLRLVQVAG